MHKVEHEEKIIQILELNKTARVDELSESLQVSTATIRRYLDRLAEAGRIQRIHGGARLVANQLFELPVQQRMAQNQIEKSQIGKAAAALIQDGDTVFISSGTTTLEVAKNIANKNISVVTNSIPVINHLAQFSQLNVIGIGGLLRASELSFVGHLAEQALREIYMDKVIIGIPALDLKAGLTNDYLPEVMTDRTIIERGQELIVVADNTKFGKVASAFLAPAERIQTLVTDRHTDPDTLEALRDLGIKIVIAK